MGSFCNSLHSQKRPADKINIGLTYEHSTKIELETDVKSRDNEDEIFIPPFSEAIFKDGDCLGFAEVKARTNSTAEYTSKKVKQSKIEEKQKALVRSFLRHNRWIEEKFYEIRDNILDNEKSTEE